MSQTTSQTASQTMPAKSARRIVLIDHHDNPPDDRVSTHLEKRGYQLERRYPVNGDALDCADHDLAGSVIYGGTQDVDEMEQYPFLHDEIAWIRHCHARAIPMLGICLGAQLIAHALGAKVAPMAHGKCEFGYYRITPTAEGKGWMPQPMHVTQAHFYEFELPPGATLLARGEGCANQAFRCGQTTFAVQFHPEVTTEIFQRWQNAEWAEQIFFGARGAQTREWQTALATQHDATQHDWFVGFLDQLFAESLPS